MEYESAISAKSVAHVKNSLELSRFRGPIYREFVQNWLEEQRSDLKDLLDTSLNMSEEATPQAYRMGVLIVCDFIRLQPELLTVQSDKNEHFVDRLQSCKQFIEFIEDCKTGTCFVPSVMGFNERCQLSNGIRDAIGVLD